MAIQYFPRLVGPDIWLRQSYFCFVFEHSYLDCQLTVCIPDLNRTLTLFSKKKKLSRPQSLRQGVAKYCTVYIYCIPPANKIKFYKNVECFYCLFNFVCHALSLGCGSWSVFGRTRMTFLDPLKLLDPDPGPWNQPIFWIFYMIKSEFI